MTFCQVCFAGADTITRESLNVGIGVLLLVTAVVLGAFARFFMSLARRSRDAAHLVEERGFAGDAFEEGIGSHPKRA
jgi:hypothetical protein